MPDQVTTTVENVGLEVVNGIIQAFMSGGEAAAEIYITSLNPAVFAIPVVAFLVDQGVHWLGQFLSIAGQKFADKLVIDFQTKQEGSDVLNTATELQFALASDDQTAIAKATQDLRDAYRSALAFDGYATPK